MFVFPVNRWQEIFEMKFVNNRRYLDVPMMKFKLEFRKFLFLFSILCRFFFPVKMLLVILSSLFLKMLPKTWYRFTSIWRSILVMSSWWISMPKIGEVHSTFFGSKRRGRLFVLWGNGKKFKLEICFAVNFYLTLLSNLT